MLNLGLLEVLIGLFFVYLVLALMCTAVNEWHSGRKRLRASTLDLGIKRLLGKPGETGSLYESFYNHPLIAALCEKGKQPSYLQPKTFVQVVCDWISATDEKGEAKPFSASASEYAKNKPGSPLASLLRFAGNNRVDFEARVEAWFNEAMDRVGGNYRRAAQKRNLVIAVLLSFAANADTLRMIDVLFKNPVLRDQIVERARQRVEPPPAAYTDSDTADAGPTIVPSLQDVAAERAAFASEDAKLLAPLVGWSVDIKELNRRLAEAAAIEKLGKGQPAVIKLRDCRAAKKLAGSRGCQNPCDADKKPCEEARKLAGCRPCVDVLEEIEKAASQETFQAEAVHGAPAVFVHWLAWVLSQHFAGWLMTAIAISMGAPFWFNLLQNLLKLRSSVSATETQKANGTKEAKKG